MTERERPHGRAGNAQPADEGCAPDVSAPDAYTFMQILDAFYDSAKSGEKVYIAS